MQQYLTAILRIDTNCIFIEMNNPSSKNVLILGANSDVAKQALLLYAQKGFHITAASRSIEQLELFVKLTNIDTSRVEICYFDATDFGSHAAFYKSLRYKPHIVLYAAGYLVNNEDALIQWEAAHQMMNVHYCGAVSIVNLIATDKENHSLERIVGLSSLSGVRGRRSNFIYGSTKAAFTQYLAGLRQYLFKRNIVVNVVIAGYIRSKMTARLSLPESLLLEPSFIARAVVNAGNRFVIVPGIKWKIIYTILIILPEKIVARLP
ncbi:MAG: SDR family NAD(P)-dependent oxidoreductase [Chitinophagaceae bacterium]